MNCDGIARVYRVLELAAFGKRLERHRRHLLPSLPEEGWVLVLGDGDGRFLAELLLARPRLRIDALELSGKMLAVMRERLSRLPVHTADRVILQQADVMQAQLAEAKYSAVVAHFFLDCFSEAQLGQLLRQIRHCCRTGAIFVLSEFQIPAEGWKRWHAHVWLAIMYRFFRIATGLTTQSLPSYQPLLEEQGWTRLRHHSSMADFVCSELWSRLPDTKLQPTPSSTQSR